MSEISSIICHFLRLFQFTSLSIDVNDPTGNLLLENVLSGTFQAAQRSSNNENRESSGLAYSPPLTICTDSLQSNTGRQNFNQKPLNSSPLTNDDSYYEQRRLLLTSKTLEATFDPPVNTLELNSRLAPSAYRPTQLSSCSSSSSSSSSNQSYGDAFSPSAYQMPFTPPIDEQFNQDFENFSFWKQQDCTESTEKTVIDNIDNQELWTKVLQELVNGLEGENNVEVDGTREKFPTSTGINYQQTNPEELSVNFSPRPSDVSCPDFVSLLNSPSNYSSSSTTVADANFNTFETIKATNTTDDLHIPKMVASFESCHRRQR